MLQVRLAVLRDGLIVEVWDSDITAPTPSDETDSAAESGRGLFIVEALSRRWNFYRPEGGGKWVWAELGIKPKPGPLPKRAHSRRPPSAEPLEVATDGQLMRRVLEGLRSL